MKQYFHIFVFVIVAALLTGCLPDTTLDFDHPSNTGGDEVWNIYQQGEISSLKFDPSLGDGRVIAHFKAGGTRECTWTSVGFQVGEFEAPEALVVRRVMDGYHPRQSDYIQMGIRIPTRLRSEVRKFWSKARRGKPATLEF